MADAGLLRVLVVPRAVHLARWFLADHRAAGGVDRVLLHGFVLEVLRQAARRARRCLSALRRYPVVRAGHLRGDPDLRPVVSSLATVTAAGLPRLKTGASRLPGVKAETAEDAAVAVRRLGCRFVGHGALRTAV